MVLRDGVLLSLVMVCGHLVRAQNDRGFVQDTATQLRTVEVFHERWQLRTTASTALDSARLSGSERSSLRGALQWIPGVQYDERGWGGSARLGIRGSTVRSPFGTRGIKAYWGPFSLTLADGSTPLELLDPLLVERATVVRSVGGAEIGTAPYGLLLAEPFLASRDEAVVRAAVTGGSNGFIRGEALAAFANDRSAITAGALVQRNDGYREQEWNRRDQAFMATRWTMGPVVARSFITWQRAAWALPGGLNEETARRDPRLANSYSQSIDAHVAKEQVFGGAAFEMPMRPWLQIRTSLQGQAIDKHNPYGTSPAASGEKEESINAAGGRIALVARTGGKYPHIIAQLGMEGMVESDDLLDTDIEMDSTGQRPILTDALTRATNVDLFASLHAQLNRRWSILVTIGNETTGHVHHDRLADLEYEDQRDPAGLYSAAIHHQTTEAFGWHLRIAHSINRPTIWELLDDQDGWNGDLKDESVNEGELGLTIGEAHWPLRCTLTLFDRRSTDMIQTVPTADGNDVFTNGTEARLGGMEGEVDLSVVEGARLDAQVIATIAYYSMRYDEMSIDPGAYWAGVPDLSGSLLIRFDLRHEWGLEIGARGSSSCHTSTLDLEPQAPAYAVIHARLTRRFPLGATALELFVNAENLTDELYSSFVQINAPGDRYFNPAPGRSFAGGVRFNFAGTGRRD